MNNCQLSVGVVYFEKGDGMASPISDTLSEFGCKVSNFLYNDKIPEKLDVVLSYGPLHSLIPLTKQLLGYPPYQRPLFVFWMTEQLPNPDLPEWVRYPLGLSRSLLERWVFHKDIKGNWQPAPYLSWITKKGYRFRYYGDLHLMRREGILSVLAMSSKWTANFLQVRGFQPIVGYMGYYPDCGTPLKLERDIPVLWLGKIGSTRRKHLLERIRAELKERGVEMLVVDGVENPYIFGEARTKLLNRTKIVLNLLREKWDDNSMRYNFAAPNQALIITEPTLPHTPFVNGVHLIESPIDQMADKICYYLSQDTERQQIAYQAFKLVTTELTMHNGIAHILNQIYLMQK